MTSSSLSVAQQKKPALISSFEYFRPTKDKAAKEAPESNKQQCDDFKK